MMAMDTLNIVVAFLLIKYNQRKNSELLVFFSKIEYNRFEDLLNRSKSSFDIAKHFDPFNKCCLELSFICCASWFSMVCKDNKLVRSSSRLSFKNMGKKEKIKR